MAAWKRYALGAWLPVMLMAAWQWMATHDVIDPLFFPPPSALLAAGGKMLASGELAGHVRATLTRALGGFLAGGVAGLAFGLVMGASGRLRASTEPMLSALFATPKLSLFPMLLLLLGVGDAAKIALIALSTFMFAAHPFFPSGSGLRLHQAPLWPRQKNPNRETLRLHSMDTPPASPVRRSIPAPPNRIAEPGTTAPASSRQMPDALACAFRALEKEASMTREADSRIVFMGGSGRSRR